MCCGVSGCSGAFVAEKSWPILALWGRLRREVAVFQGVGALGAGSIYLIGVNKSAWVTGPGRDGVRRSAAPPDLHIGV